MGFKSANKIIIEDAAITADQQSEAIEMLHLHGFSIQVEWTSTTAAATVQIEVSNDGVIWIPLASPTQAISNDSGTVMFNVIDVYYKFFRLDIDTVTGSITTFKATYNGKAS